MTVNSVPSNPITPDPRSVPAERAAFAKFACPFTVSNKLLMSVEPSAVVSVPPLATVMTGLSNCEVEVSDNSPALTVVGPLRPLRPLKVRRSPEDLMRLPTPLIAPAKVPTLTVRVDPLRFTAPLPINDWIVTAGFSKFAVPSACKAVNAGIEEPREPLNTAPRPTFSTVLASVPLKVSKPPVTVVFPV